MVKGGVSQSPTLSALKGTLDSGKRKAGIQLPANAMGKTENRSWERPNQSAYKVTT